MSRWSYFSSIKRKKKKEEKEGNGRGD